MTDQKKSPPTPKLAEAKKLIENWEKRDVKPYFQSHPEILWPGVTYIKNLLAAQDLISYERGREDIAKIEFICGGLEKNIKNNELSLFRGGCGNGVKMMESYRCADCTASFHRKCIKKHFTEAQQDLKSDKEECDTCGNGLNCWRRNAVCMNIENFTDQQIDSIKEFALALISKTKSNL